MRILIAPKISAGTPTHRVNSRGYRTHWQDYGVDFVIRLGSLC
jgi:hypothetical protein